MWAYRRDAKAIVAGKEKLRVFIKGYLPYAVSETRKYLHAKHVSRIKTWKIVVQEKILGKMPDAMDRLGRKGNNRTLGQLICDDDRIKLTRAVTQLIGRQI